MIILFMSFAAVLLVVSNALFDGTEKGIQNSFTESFTGDFIIRPVSKAPLSLFGDETPITGELTEIETLVPYESILEFLSSNPLVSGFVPQVSGVALLENGTARKTMSLFGVQGDIYLDMMKGAKLVEGRAYTFDEKGMIVSDKVATELGITVGKTVQFTIADGTSFRIRAVPVTGIIRYESPNVIFERFVLVNPDTVRDIMDIADSYAYDDTSFDETTINLLDEDLNFDDLFSSAGDVDAIFEDSSLMDTSVSTEAEEIDTAINTAWNYLVCMVQEGGDAKQIIKNLNKEFKDREWPVEAVNWRHAAGSTALYLYWMRMIFNIGVLIVMAAGFIVVNNTLVVSVLDRTREIGTMRALGASSLFVSLQCMIETVSMALAAGLIGCFVGSLVSLGLTSMEIIFTNSFLIQLFGEGALVVGVSLGNVVEILFLMLCLGILGWIYPVITALKVQPIEAIQGVR
ncbi:MAG: ABC transporter permease [Spirochaetaceae bacterium]|nr:ABC transporter permease [Spirochaetaceae bacterium]